MAAILGGGLARADLLLYEGFDYGAANATLNGQGGAATEVGFLAANKWNGGNYGAVGLSFGNLRTTGGCASNISATISRKHNVSQTGRIYGSFLWRISSVGSVGAVLLSRTSNDGDNGADFDIAVDEYSGTSKCGARITGTSAAAAAGSQAATAGITYLALFTATNLVASGTANQGLTVWVLSTNQFAYWKTNALTESALNGAALGAAATQVFGRATVTKASSGSRMQAGDFLEMFIYSGAVLSYDEFRVANGSLDEVTPLNLLWGSTGTSNITANSAMAYSTLYGQSADITLFWDTADRGQNVAAWAGTNFLGTNLAAGPITGASMTNLSAAQSYTYRFYASNATPLTAWSAAGSFTSLNPAALVVSNAAAGATNVTLVSACLNGYLAATGSMLSTVSALYGPVDGGTNAGAWASTNAFLPGQWNAGDYPVASVTGLVSGQNYYYTYFASNSAVTTIAAPSQYFITGEITVQAGDPVCGVTSTDTGTFIVSRPDPCTNQALSVHFAMSGTATSGVQYATSATGSVMIAAGATSATITTTPLSPWNYGPPRSMVLTVLPGAYAVGAAASATGTLATSSTPIRWGGTTNYWTNSVYWIPSGSIPKNGFVGVIDSGQALIGTKGSSELYNPALGETAPSEIRVQTNGTLRFCFVWPNTCGLTNNCNLALLGGTLIGDSSDWTTSEYDADLSVGSDSTIQTWQARSIAFGIKLVGALRNYDATHTGRLTKTGNGNFTVSLPSTNFTGGWNILGGETRATAAQALGTGPITVSTGAQVGWSCSDSNLPSITLAGGTLVIYGSGSFDLAPGQALTVNGGGIGESGDYATVNYNMPMTVSGNCTLGGAGRSAENWNGDILNTGNATLALAGTDANYFKKANCAYTGNWIIPAGMSVTADASGAMGAGGRLELRPNASFGLSQSLTLRNVITGSGATIGASGKTLTLQPYYTNATLYAAGIAPGTNGGAAIGLLALTGNLSFANLTNYDGAGHDAGCSLTVKFVDDPASPGTALSDLLYVSGSVAGISNVDLVVNAAGASAAALARGSPRTILSAANSFAGQAFRSVTFLGQTGTVTYATGAVQMAFSYPGPLVDNTAGASNITTTSALLCGVLTSTGTAPAHVYAYWGTTDGGTNPAAWRGVLDLGICPAGPVSATLSDLVRENLYYYRLYAANDNGAQWALSSSLFVAAVEPADYGRRLRVTFPGYTRGETLANFPALVVLNEAIPGFKYADFKSASGYDLRFVSAAGSRTLAYEFDTWNPASNSYVWVQLDTLAASNTWVWAYYRNAAVTSAPAVYTTNGATWSSGYLGVLHMSQTNTADATRLRGAAASFGNTNAAGVVGGGQGFNGGSAYLSMPGSFANFTPGLTISLWTCPTNAASWARFVDLSNGQSSDNLIFARNGTTADLAFQAFSSGSAGTVVNATGVLASNTWQYVTVTETSGGAVVLYRNGVAAGTGTTTVPLNIARTQNYVGRSAWTDPYYAGLMDELRIENVTRSSNWVWACWMNMASNASFAVVQSVPFARGTSLYFR